MIVNFDAKSAGCGEFLLQHGVQEVFGAADLVQIVMLLLIKIGKETAKLFKITLVDQVIHIEHIVLQFMPQLFQSLAGSLALGKVGFLQLDLLFDQRVPDLFVIAVADGKKHQVEHHTHQKQDRFQKYRERLGIAAAGQGVYGIHQPKIQRQVDKTGVQPVVSWRRGLKTRAYSPSEKRDQCQNGGQLGEHVDIHGIE